MAPPLRPPAPARRLRRRALAAWHRGWRGLAGGGGRRGTLAFALALLAAAAMLVVGELGYRASAHQLDRLSALGAARLELLDLQRRLAEAESAQRGYLLTGRPDYLAPYTGVAADLRAATARLQARLAGLDDRALAPQLEQLQRQLQARLSEMETVLRLHDAGQRDNALELVGSGLGRDMATAVGQLGEAMRAGQDAQAAQGLQAARRALWLHRAGVAAMGLLSLALLALYLRQRLANDQQRAAQQRALQAERDGLERAVQARTRELTELATHLQTAREDERARLARELHDELGGLLTAAKLDLARLRPRLPTQDPALASRLAHLVAMLDSGIALKRRIVEDLRPSTLVHLGLAAALEVHCREFAERSGLAVALALDLPRLAPGVELTAFRLVQEALTNVAKHAGACQVTVRAGPAGDGRVELLVVDDGAGFDPAVVGPGRHGLPGMRHRVVAEGGELAIRAAPGRGTCVRAWLPLPVDAPGAAGRADADADPDGAVPA